jgi:glycosyltransferase involved in cell wall biosynthesis
MHPSILGLFAGGFVRPDEVAGRQVLEVGSYDVNGSVRPILEAHGPASYLGVDMAEGPRVDQVTDVTDLIDTFGADSFDVVVTTEMLEHAADWQAAVANLVRVVRPGGLLVITTRSPGFPYHPHPEDHWRYSVEVMRRILEACELEVLACFPDPDPAQPGVVAKARKPQDWSFQDLSVGNALLEVDGVEPVTEPLTIMGLPHAPDGSGYYRFYLPFKHLAAASGHAVLIPQPGVRVVPQAHELDQDGRHVDVLAAQRPAGGPGLKWWSSLQGKTRLVYETDDDLLRVDPSGLAHLHDERMRDSVRQCLQMADLVTVSTPALAERMAAHNPNVVVLPNMVNADLLTLERTRRARVTLGWEGSVSHLVDLAPVADPLSAVLRKHPSVDLHFVGSDWSPLLKLGPTRAGRLRFTPWQQNVWDAYRAVDFDIALAPLADTPFCQTKSHIRALEAMAMGIPVVASDVPAYRDLVVDGVTGFLCRSDGDWKRRLSELINDAELRGQMGAKGREVAAGWTIQEHWTRWRDAYQGVAGG